jgi:hypothetical protein
MVAFPATIGEAAEACEVIWGKAVKTSPLHLLSEELKACHSVSWMVGWLNGLYLCIRSFMLV